jgi:hypothetical protein
VDKTISESETTHLQILLLGLLLLDARYDMFPESALSSKKTLTNGLIPWSVTILIEGSEREEESRPESAEAMRVTAASA